MVTTRGDDEGGQEPKPKPPDPPEPKPTLDIPIGTLNCRVGHKNPEGLAERIADIIVRDELVLCFLQEGRQVARHLSKDLARDGYHIIFKNAGAPFRDNIIVTTLPINGWTTVNMGGIRWERAKRNRHLGLHAPRRGLAANLDGTRFGALHGPPRPHNSNWPRRRRAKNVYYEHVEEYGDQWNENGHFWLWGGDANISRSELRPMVDRLDATMEFRGNKGPDGFIAGPGVNLTEIEVQNLSGWFNHPFVTGRMSF